MSLPTSDWIGRLSVRIVRIAWRHGGVRSTAVRGFLLGFTIVASLFLVKRSVTTQVVNVATTATFAGRTYHSTVAVQRHALGQLVVVGPRSSHMFTEWARRAHGRPDALYLGTGHSLRACLGISTNLRLHPLALAESSGGNAVRVALSGVSVFPGTIVSKVHVTGLGRDASVGGSEARLSCGNRSVVVRDSVRWSRGPHGGRDGDIAIPAIPCTPRPHHELRIVVRIDANGLYFLTPSYAV